jgi:NAD(P)-dependent dehydrogenase (short-subunit alcohol dehydrogenase family)
MAETIERELGGLHGILHCAAEFTGLKPLEATPPEEFVRQLHVNLTAPWLLTQACLPLLRKSGDSAVVFVGEDLSRVNRAYWGTYGVAKAGLMGLVRILHDETDNSTVRVSALQPGPMRSNIRARAFVEEAATRVPSPSAYADSCVHLLSPAGVASRGQVLTLDLPA